MAIYALVIAVYLTAKVIGLAVRLGRGLLGRRRRLLANAPRSFCNGDPRTGPVDMIDWIELISIGETRNCVQRVPENVVMYRALRHDPAPILTGHPVDAINHTANAPGWLLQLRT